jgi:8-oxo-dGTP pyrophosphatase MutT (NUDIX family)
MIQPWKTVRSEPTGNFRIFTIRTDHVVSPRTGAEHDVFIIDSVNWVNVIAVTPERQLVMIEQFRHGTGTVELEIPGGMIDASDESPLAAGLRELREETGYEGSDSQIIGKIFPNPAIMSNTCFTVLTTNCLLRHALKWDSGEDLVTRLVPLDEIPGLMASGKIGHSLVAVALYHFDLWQRGLKSAAAPVV